MEQFFQVQGKHVPITVIDGMVGSERNFTAVNYAANTRKLIGSVQLIDLKELMDIVGIDFYYFDIYRF